MVEAKELYSVRVLFARVADMLVDGVLSYPEVTMSSDDVEEIVFSRPSTLTVFASEEEASMFVDLNLSFAEHVADVDTAYDLREENDKVLWAREMVSYMVMDAGEYLRRRLSSARRDKGDVLTVLREWGQGAEFLQVAE